MRWSGRAAGGLNTLGRGVTERMHLRMDLPTSKGGWNGGHRRSRRAARGCRARAAIMGGQVPANCFSPACAFGLGAPHSDDLSRHQGSSRMRPLTVSADAHAGTAMESESAPWLGSRSNGSAVGPNMRGPGVSLDRNRLSNGSRIHATRSGDVAGARDGIPTGRLRCASARWGAISTCPRPASSRHGRRFGVASRSRRPAHPLTESAQPGGPVARLHPPSPPSEQDSHRSASPRPPGDVTRTNIASALVDSYHHAPGPPSDSGLLRRPWSPSPCSQPSRRREVSQASSQYR